MTDSTAEQLQQLLISETTGRRNKLIRIISEMNERFEAGYRIQAADMDKHDEWITDIRDRLAALESCAHHEAKQLDSLRDRCHKAERRLDRHALANSTLEKDLKAITAPEGRLKRLESLEIIARAELDTVIRNTPDARQRLERRIKGLEVAYSRHWAEIQAVDATDASDPVKPAANTGIEGTWVPLVGVQTSNTDAPEAQQASKDVKLLDTVEFAKDVAEAFLRGREVGRKEIIDGRRTTDDVNELREKVILARKVTEEHHEWMKQTMAGPAKEALDESFKQGEIAALPDNWHTFHAPGCGTRSRGCVPECPKDTYERTGKWIGCRETP